MADTPVLARPVLTLPLEPDDYIVTMARFEGVVLVGTAAERLFVLDREGDALTATEIVRAKGEALDG